jgi:hypothetical protein
LEFPAGGAQVVCRELFVEQPRGSARLDVVAERLEQPSRLGDRGTTTAFSTGLAASMRAIALSASSAGVTSPSATRSRSATASSHPRSSAGTGGAYAISHAHLVQPGDVQQRVRLVLRATFSGGHSSFYEATISRG